MTRRRTELDDRDEPPMSASPLLIRMSAKATIGFLPDKERAEESLVEALPTPAFRSVEGVRTSFGHNCGDPDGH